MLNQIPPITRNILIANIIVFVLRFLVGPYVDMHIYDFGALHALESGEFKIWQLITNMFMHANFFHILFNMLIFVMLGRELERRWGPKRFFQFYMISGIVAGLAFLFIMKGNASATGASGAVMGVMVAFAMLYPDAEFGLILIPVPIKAKYYVPGLMAMDLFGFIQPQSDGVAHIAHLGGAAAGAILVLIFRRMDMRRRY